MFRIGFLTRLGFCACALAAIGRAKAAAPQVKVHDPSAVETNGACYLYSTGPGIPFYRSTDLIHWEAEGHVFPAAPAWASREIPGFTGHLWAPDVVKRDGKFYLYYAASAFGKNLSAIGLAISDQVDPSMPGYRWVDQGIVVRSIPGRDLWNAIDPNVTQDEEGHWWLAFGSFWDGLRLVRLSDDGRSLAEPQEWHAIAKGERSNLSKDSDPGPAQIEAPYIYHHGDYYYLFVSAGLCCRGKDSTYHVIVGRARDIRGPYLDKAGTDMAQGGGTPFLMGDEDWPGLGHNGILEAAGKTYVVFHAYETADHGIQKLKLAELGWSGDGWPVADPKALHGYHSELLIKP